MGPAFLRGAGRLFPNRYPSFSIRFPGDDVTPCGNFDTSLPIDDALPRLTAALGGKHLRRAGRATRRRQDHARAARAARRALGAGREDHGVGTASSCGPCRRLPHGIDAGRASRRHRRPARALRLGVAPDARRGRHRGCFTPVRARRSRGSTASPPCSSTSFTSVHSTPISVWRWRSTPSRACART